MTAIVILAGGDGSRIGGDKAGRLLAGRPLLQWVVSAAEEIASEIIVAGSPAEKLPEVRTTACLRFYTDATIGRGPLSGIAAGLACTSDRQVIVVPCDAPLLRPAMIDGMLAARGDAEVVVPEVSGRLQAAFGVWSTSCLSVVRDALGSDDRSLHGVLRQLRTRVMGEDELRGFDADLRSFINVNTRDDLAAMEARIAGMRSGTKPGA